MERQRRYPSDLTDAQWEIVEPMLPLIKSPGRVPKHPRRAIVDAILYVVRSGCSWRQLPVDFLADGLLAVPAVGEAPGHRTHPRGTARTGTPARRPRTGAQRGD